ncbi:hypothetical protein [Streptomyces sp. NPDC055085]
MDAYQIESLLLDCLPASESGRSDYQLSNVRQLAALLASHEQRLATLEQRLNSE